MYIPSKYLRASSESRASLILSVSVARSRLTRFLNCLELSCFRDSFFGFCRSIFCRRRTQCPSRKFGRGDRCQWSHLELKCMFR